MRTKSVILLVLAGCLISQPGLGQHSAEAPALQYASTFEYKTVEIEPWSLNLLCLSDILRSGEEWRYDPVPLFDATPIRVEFVLAEEYIYLLSTGKIGGINQTLIQQLSYQGNVLHQIGIPNSQNLCSVMELGPDRLLCNSPDSLYLLDNSLNVIKQIKGPDQEIIDFDVIESGIFVLTENDLNANYQITGFDSNLDITDSWPIQLSAPGHSVSSQRIALNEGGEIFLSELWQDDLTLSKIPRYRKLNTDMTYDWEVTYDQGMSGDTSALQNNVFAPLDDGGLLVHGAEQTGLQGVYLISSEGEMSNLLEGVVGLSHETDSSYSFVVDGAAFRYSKKGGFLPWYHKVQIEYVSWMNPNNSLCMPDPETGLQLQLDAGFPGADEGVHWSDGAIENPHTIHKPGKYWANFIFHDRNIGFTDTFIVEDHVTVVEKPELELEYEGELHICQGSSLDLTVNVNNDHGGDYTYNLEGVGSFDQTIQLTDAGMHTIKVTDNYGCDADTSIELQVKQPYADAMCMVTVDDVSHKNIIVLKKTPEKGTSEYKITRGFGHTEIGTLAWEGANYLVDESSDPKIQAYRYFLTSTDTCGNSVMNEQSHKTMHLTANVGTSGEVNLIWEAYQGVNSYQYNFYRSTDGKNFEKIGAMEYDPDINQYSDYDHPIWRLFYKVGIVGDFDCSLLDSKKAAPAAGTEIFSNVKEMNISGINSQVTGTEFELYPNPASDRFVLYTQLPGTGSLKMQLVSLLGRVVFEQELSREETEITLPLALSEGLYLVRISGYENGLSSTAKVLIK